MILLRVLARVVTFLLLVLLALFGVAVAVSCLGSGPGAFSLPWLAEQLRLDVVGDGVRDLLSELEGPGSAPAVPLLAGIGAMLLGFLLLAGLLVPRRERLITLSITAGEGRLTARRRPLGQVAGTLVEQVRGVTGSKVKVRARRRSGGRVRVCADRSRSVDPGTVNANASEALADLTSSFKLKASVRSRLGDGGSRVE